VSDDQLGMFDPLPDPGENRLGKFNNPHTSGAPETQRQAAVAVYPSSGSLRLKVLNAIGLSPYGMTDHELERKLKLRHQTVSARRNELLKDGWIVDSERRRLTDTGRKAVVWVVSSKQKIGTSKARPRKKPWPR